MGNKIPSRLNVPASRTAYHGTGRTLGPKALALTCGPATGPVNAPSHGGCGFDSLTSLLRYLILGCVDWSLTHCFRRLVRRSRLFLSRARS